MENNVLKIDLLKILIALWKKAWAIVLVAAIFGGAMFAYGSHTYVPTYAATAILCTSHESIDDNSFTQLNPIADRLLVGTCISVLDTRALQEEVIQAANLDLTSSTLASMIRAKDINETELFKITVTSNDADQAALIANTVAQILPEKVSLVNKNCKVQIIDNALVPTAPQSNSIAENTVIFAFIGAFLACCVVATLDIRKQVKEQKIKKLA